MNRRLPNAFAPAPFAPPRLVTRVAEWTVHEET